MARTYTTYLSTTSRHDDGGLTLVKDGFSWPAFFLAVPWALWHRMWIVAAALLVLEIAVAVLPGLVGLGDLAQGALSLGLALAIGLAAADLRDVSLRARGHRAADVVVAQNRDMAERRFLENHPQLAADLAAAIGD